LNQFVGEFFINPQANAAALSALSPGPRPNPPRA
jgi:hypothetical protein